MNVLVVHCHPATTSLVAQARDRVLQRLGARGHAVRQIDLYAEGFSPVLSAWERRHHLDDPAGKPSIAAHAALLRWCDAMVVLYPTWWSGQPAMLKGWFDRVWVNGVAYTLPDGSDRIRPALRNIRRIVTITTHGSSKWHNTLQGEGGKRIMSRSMRAVCSPRCRTTWLSFYGADRADTALRLRFLDRVDRAMARLR